MTAPVANRAGLALVEAYADVVPDVAARWTLRRAYLDGAMLGWVYATRSSLTTGLWHGRLLDGRMLGPYVTRSLAAEALRAQRQLDDIIGSERPDR